MIFEHQYLQFRKKEIFVIKCGNFIIEEKRMERLIFPEINDIHEIIVLFCNNNFFLKI